MLSNIEIRKYENMVVFLCNVAMVQNRLERRHEGSYGKKPYSKIKTVQAYSLSQDYKCTPHKLN